MPSKIFVSYRREDAAAEAARIRDRLTTVFGFDNVFMDIDALKPGQRFDEELAKALSTCDAFLAVIGPRWYDIAYARTQAGGHDYVREEIATALARNITVIPILIDRTILPRPETLPDDLRPLVLHQSYQIRHEHFGRDVEALIATLAGRPGRSKSMRGDAVGWRRTGIVASIVWIFVGYFLGNNVEVDAGRRWYDMAYEICKVGGSKNIHQCHVEASEDAGRLHWNNAWQSGAVAAIVPIPLVWLLVWIVFRLSRWIRQGFKII
jgi:TIR domain